MKVKVNKNRQVFKGSLSVGISNENNYEVLEFTFPAELDNYIKYIEIQAENEEGKLEYVDRIQDNKFTLTNRLTKYRELTMEVSCRDLNRTVFKSEIFTVTTGEALNILEDLVEQQEDLFERVERELQEVYQGMEEFKTEIVEDANSRFNTNVTEKTQGFNTNAETKTTDFNNNYDTKLNAFNSNYDEKLGTFNTNATSKLEQYNNNDTAKTGAYNTNATEKLSVYNTNATNKVAEYNTNAETKLNAYNTNATQKLAEYDNRVADLHEDLDETQAKVEQYNTNIDTKYTQYNTNATEKLNAYNQNATTKTNAYNTNAQTKLEAYNTNATEKTTAYNENAEEKIEEYNDNASELMQSVETLEQKHDTEVAELQAEITDLQTDLNMATDLIPTGEATGSDITVNDSARYYFKKFEIEGKSEQETFTGKNIVKSLYYRGASTLNFYINEKKVVSSMIISGITNVSVNNMTIYLKFGSVTYTLATFNMVANQKFSVSITLTEEQINAIKEAENVYIQLYRPSASSADLSTCTYDEMMLRNSSTTDSYEKYVGGQPAPSSIYECPIQNVTGDVEVKVENKNLFDKDNANILNDLYLESSNKKIDYTSGCKILYIDCKPNTTYTVSKKISSRFAIGSCSSIPARNVVCSDVIQQNTSTSISITTDNLDKYLCVWYYGQSLDTLTEQEIRNSIQIEEGSTATPYEPHEEQTVTFPLSEGQILHEGDTIEDKIVQRRNTLILDGSDDENWAQYTTNVYSIPRITTKRDCLSNYYKFSNVDRASLLNDGEFCIANDANSNLVLFKNNNINSVEDFKTWLSTHNVKVEYELATPLEIEFTQAQVTAKAQIDKLYSYKGTTHITSEANLNVIYRKDPSLAEEQQNNKLEELEARIVLLEG